MLEAVEQVLAERRGKDEAVRPDIGDAATGHRLGEAAEICTVDDNAALGWIKKARKQKRRLLLTRALGPNQRDVLIEAKAERNTIDDTMLLFVH